MRKLAALICGIAALAVVSGCTTTHVSQWSAPLQVQLAIPVTPIIETGDEITGKAVMKKLFGVFSLGGSTTFADGVMYAGDEGAGAGLFGDSTSDGKAAAAYDACSKNQADIIIAPRYTIETKSYIVYTETTVNVKGYKGVFKGLKK